MWLHTELALIPLILGRGLFGCSNRCSPPELSKDMLVTKEMIREAASDRGGFTSKQIKYAQEKFPGSWKRQLIGSEVSKEWWDGFVDRRKKSKKKKVKAKVINTFSVKKDWSWKPDVADVPPIKISSKKDGRKKKKRERVSRLDSAEFYRSREWLELRVRVLERYECKCMMCGRSPRDHGIVIHVDHIKPRSKRPDLSLEFTNLQLLCEDCNKGKSNKYDTDWRPVDEILDSAHLDSIDGIFI